MDTIRKSLIGKHTLLLFTLLSAFCVFLLSGCTGTAEEMPVVAETGAPESKTQSYDSKDGADGAEIAVSPESKKAVELNKEDINRADVAESDNPASNSTSDTRDATLPGNDVNRADPEEKAGSTERPDDRVDPEQTSETESWTAEERAVPAAQEGETKKSDTNGTGIVLSANDDSTWNNSFLLFLPQFNGGIEEGRVCEETFDHIIIGGIESKRMVEDYVEDVKSAGFDVEADYVDHNGEIDFHAYNSDGWYVTVDYDIKTGKADIGCGFFKEEKEKDAGSYFPEEILAILPMPEIGTLSGGRADGDSPYALFEGCTLGDAHEYADALRQAGFDKEAVEGEANDLCWYCAKDAEGLICDMQYADGIIMIGCEKKEE